MDKPPDIPIGTKLRFVGPGSDMTHVWEYAGGFDVILRAAITEGGVVVGLGSPEYGRDVIRRWGPGDWVVLEPEYNTDIDGYWE
jgi:hypothetical protein